MPTGYLKNICGSTKKGGHHRGLSYRQRRGGGSKGSCWNSKANPVAMTIAKLDKLPIREQLELWDQYPSHTERYRAGMIRSSNLPKRRRKPKRKGGKSPKYF